jgi:Polyketide cyclase / dehydrase and lipid transport.
MLTVERDITIARRVEEVFAFVADFNHFTLWSTDVVKAELLNGPQVGVGTRARITRGSSRVDLQACKLGTGRRFTTS